MSTTKEPHQHRSGLIVPGRSYVAAATNKKYITTTKQSLLIKSIEPAGSSNDSNSESRDLKTRIWRHSRSPGGYLLDVSSLNIPDQVHLTTIGQQYGAKNFYGIKFLGRTQQRYIEIYPGKTILHKFETEGVHYEKQKIRLLPCKAIEGNGKVIQISLTDIPYLPDNEITDGLKEALGHFGHILDIGLHQESIDGWFMGTGYAVIQQDENTQYPELHHTIPWGDSGEFCHATFPDMPTWCRYCHEEGHTKFGCKKALASILCYACDKYGHKQVDCPEMKYGAQKANPYKKARKTSKIHERSPTPPPSDELMKSIHAPSGKQQETKQVSTTLTVRQGTKDTILDKCFNKVLSDDEDFIPSSDEDEQDDMESVTEDKLNPSIDFEDEEMIGIDQTKTEVMLPQQEKQVQQQVILTDISSSHSGMSLHSPTNNQ